MATAILGAGASVLGGRAAAQEGQFNRQIEERNAEKLRMVAQTAIKLGNRDVKIFERKFANLQAQTEMAFLKSGVKLEGTALEVLENNYALAELEKETIRYNAQVESADKVELSVIAQMEGEAAYARGKNQKKASYLQAGQTLLGGGGQAASQKSSGNKYWWI